MTIDHAGILHRFRFACSRPLCFYNVMVASEAKRDAMERDHPCPWYAGGTTTFSWGSMADEYLAPIWNLLDEEVKTIQGDVDFDREEARIRARAYARVLALLMQPFFTEPDAIVREAIRRHSERKKGEEPETPGIGRLRWKRPEATVGDPSHPSWQVGEYDPDNPTPVKHNLTDEQVAKIKAAKGMPVQMLSVAYGVEARIILALQKG